MVEMGFSPALRACALPILRLERLRPICPVIAKSAATTQSSSLVTRQSLDCFAPLAMTAVTVVPDLTIPAIRAKHGRHAHRILRMRLASTSLIALTLAASLLGACARRTDVP